jgi:hypothetical protein
MTKHFANCVGLLVILVLLAAHGACQTPPFACGGQFPGPGGCLHQHLRISDVIYSPYDNVAFGGLDGPVNRRQWDDSRIVWDFGQPDSNHGYFQIKSAYGGLFISGNRGALEPRMWFSGECDLDPTQCLWEFLSWPNSFTRIRNVAVGRCLTVPSPNNWALPLQLQPCGAQNSDTSQFFWLDPAPN